MLVSVDCNGKEYDELVKQLKEEKVSYTTETKKLSIHHYRNDTEKTNDFWEYRVSFEYSEKLI